MKKNIYLNYFLVFGVMFIAFIWFTIYEKDSDYNTYKCETKQLELRGIIDRVNTRSNYMQAHIKGREKSFSLNISKEVYKKGFPKYYDYEVGDSIIKKANSKVFTIKNGKRVAIYELDCND